MLCEDVTSNISGIMLSLSSIHSGCKNQCVVMKKKKSLVSSVAAVDHSRQHSKLPADAFFPLPFSKRLSTCLAISLFPN